MVDQLSHGPIKKKKKEVADKTDQIVEQVAQWSAQRKWERVATLIWPNSAESWVTVCNWTWFDPIVPNFLIVTSGLLFRGSHALVFMRAACVSLEKKRKSWYLYIKNKIVHVVEEANGGSSVSVSTAHDWRRSSNHVHWPHAHWFMAKSRRTVSIALVLCAFEFQATKPMEPPRPFFLCNGLHWLDLFVWSNVAVSGTSGRHRPKSLPRLSWRQICGKFAFLICSTFQCRTHRSRKSHRLCKINELINYNCAWLNDHKCNQFVNLGRYGASSVEMNENKVRP